jgi:glyoxylate carboligase
VAQNASDVLVDALHDWGVNVIFGFPGEEINGMMEALRERQDKIRFIHVRHETLPRSWRAPTPDRGTIRATILEEKERKSV